MRKYNAHKSSLFLIELIIAIAFFALASGICLQLFVKSHLLSRETTRLNTAVNLAVSAAETFRQCEGDQDTLLELMPELTEAEASDASAASKAAVYNAFYDENGTACKDTDATYILALELDETNASAQITVLLAEDAETLYELPVQIHRPTAVNIR